MPKKGKIILLNGTSSAGKSSLARALQAVTAEPFLHVPMDAFLEMMPPQYANHPEAFHFVPLDGSAPPEVAISMGPYGARVMQGMRSAMAAMARDGLNLIIDTVMLDDEWPLFESLLAEFDLHLVGIFADIDVVERRERQRGDRDIGQARWQSGRVHKGLTYDLTVDTSRVSPDEAATQIKAAFSL
tara:strand:- start:558 stop:1115 length:558 start_codon:yes stop_codon:yes gene_type:complete